MSPSQAGLLGWSASTRAGAALGALAAREVRVAISSPAWWTAPLEPLRWFDDIVGTAPHIFYTVGLFAAVGGLTGLWWGRRSRSRLGGVTLAVIVMMLLVGQIFALRALDTVLPGGLRWVVPRGAPYVLADLHSHSQASGGALMPAQLVQWHYDHGYRVVALSDSNGLRGVPLAVRYVQHHRLPMLVVPAEEYRGTTHLLMFNLRRAVTPARYNVRAAIAEARRQGAFVVVAHPWTSRLAPTRLYAWGAEGFEVVDGNVLASRGTRALCTREALPETADLDFRTGNFPVAATVLPTWADTPQLVQRALAQGCCAALFVTDEIDRGDFHLVPELRHTLHNLRRRTLPLFLAGLAFWGLLGAIMWPLLPALRIFLRSVRLPHGESAAALALGLAAMVAGTAVECMWWQFRQGWYPRSEWALYLWAVCSPLCLVLVTRVSPPE